MQTPNKITESWISAEVVSRLKKYMEAYRPTGAEKDFDIRTLYRSIDSLSWSATLEVHEGKDWIAFPIQSPFFDKLEDNDRQVIPLRIAFFTSKECPGEILFQVNASILHIQYVEQGEIILNRFQTALNEVQGQIIQEKLKRRKLRSLIENSVDDTVKEMIKGKGFSYNLCFQQNTFELRFLLPRSKEVLFTIPYEYFADNVACIPQQLEYILMALNGFPFSLRKAETRIKWTLVP